MRNRVERPLHPVNRLLLRGHPAILSVLAKEMARLGDFDHNIALATRFVEDAVRQGAELVVFPECMDTGYLFDSAEHCRKLAETMKDGPFVKALSGLARKHGIYIASGVTEWDPDKEKIFNTGIMFDRKGEVACHYHKQFLATHDQNWFAFGERGCPVVDTDLGRIGLLICFDGRIPEIFRSMAMQGAEVIVDMANFFAMDQADMWGPARSYENGLWLVAATKAGYERSIYYPGGSMIVDPKGRAVPMRIGLASGPVVAGVVGTKKFFYDVWGDAVNVASRMESTDLVGQIQVPDDVYERLKVNFVLRERGHIAVKGKGVMRTWYLLGRKAAAEPTDIVADEPSAARV